LNSREFLLEVEGSPIGKGNASGTQRISKEGVDQAVRLSVLHKLEEVLGEVQLLVKCKALLPALLALLTD
jgi:hypothetical protein